jgi:hypothetical protein
VLPHVSLLETGLAARTVHLARLRERSARSAG